MTRAPVRGGDRVDRVMDEVARIPTVDFGTAAPVGWIGLASPDDEARPGPRRALLERLRQPSKLLLQPCCQLPGQHVGRRRQDRRRLPDDARRMRAAAQLLDGEAPVIGVLITGRRKRKTLARERAVAEHLVGGMGKVRAVRAAAEGDDDGPEL